MQNVNEQVVQQNGLVLANCAALASSIVSSIEGIGLSKTIGNQSLTRDRIEYLVSAQITSAVTAPLKG